MDRQRERRSPMQTLTAALVVFAGCYLGASIDTVMRFPEIGVAIMFLPYAVLTAALWRTPPRSWWLLCLAAAAGDFQPHRHGSSVGFALLAEVVNFARAALAALALRRFGGRRGRLDSLRAMMAYLVVAVLLAPGIVSLAGGWLVVAAHRSSHF